MDITVIDAVTRAAVNSARGLPLLNPCPQPVELIAALVLK
jgi:hypothetical protein